MLPRKCRAPKHIEIGVGKCYYTNDTEDHYRMQYFETLDLAIAGIKNRFDQPGYAMYSNLETLLLKTANQEDYSTELEKVLSFYGDDFNKSLLETQLHILGSKYADDITVSEPRNAVSL